nr:DUF3459 domain-containing protein [Methylomarinum sp. Ch1-1]MDP4519706.1 DUF3459 domain-containing protein [Methylomarinum sp. Ch1-1]
MPPRALRAATALLILQPSPPLLFMGQEWACSSPFTYFVDFPENLGEQVAEGRLNEFAKFPPYQEPELQTKIPPPNAVETFEAALLDWRELNAPSHARWLSYHRELLSIRQWHIRPRLAELEGGKASYHILTDTALIVQWPSVSGPTLTMLANLGGDAVPLEHAYQGQILFASEDEAQQPARLNPWTVVVLWAENDE